MKPRKVTVAKPIDGGRANAEDAEENQNKDKKTN